jgi:ABC-type anion transport system duplicated permease subunit
MILDDLFSAAHQHLAAAAYAAHALPFEILLLAMLLEEHKQVLQMRRLVEDIARDWLSDDDD